jgi:prevent-host-death family protein
MKVSVSEAKSQLTDLVRRAQAGDEVVLTRHGHPAVRLVPVMRKLSPKERQAVIEAVQASAANKAVSGPNAAHSQDFLYNDRGLPA